MPINWPIKKHYFVVLVILIFLGILTFYNTIQYPFVHDDVVFIRENPHIRNLDIISAFFASKYEAGRISIVNSYYRPVLDVLYSLQYKFFGLNSKLYHLFNIIVHIINSFLVYLFVLRISRNKVRFSFVIASFFLVHPIQSEAVACISGISNTMVAFFFLLSILLYDTALKENKKIKSITYFTGSIISFSFALFTKEIAVMFPIVVILIIAMTGDIYIIRKSYKKVAVSSIFIILLLMFYFTIRRKVLGYAFPLSSLWGEEFFLRIGSIPKTLLMYSRILIFPYDLHYYRSTDILAPKIFSYIMLSLILIVFFIFTKVMPYSKKRLLYFGFSWFLIMLLPVANVIPMVNEYSFIMTAEHFLYLPIIGMLIVLISFFADIIKFAGKKMKTVNIVIFVISIAVCVFITVKQNTYFSGEISLFKRMLKYEPNFGRGHMLLAKAYYFNKQYVDAIEEHKKALVIMKKYKNLTNNPYAKKIYQSFIDEIRSDLDIFYKESGKLNPRS